MQKQIEAIIQKALKEDWFNNMTTSDLQGSCQAVAMNLWRSAHKGQEDDFASIEGIQDYILNGIYDHAENNYLHYEEGNCPNDYLKQKEAQP